MEICILEQCKGVLCVDLGESLQTHIYLKNLASIQPIFLKIVRSTAAAAAEKEPCKFCPLSAYRSPRYRCTDIDKEEEEKTSSGKNLSPTAFISE